MDRLFDFFADNPNVPKLLVRRIVENADIDIGVERDVLVPAWDVFSAWMKRLGHQKISDTDLRLFMLSVHSVLLLYLARQPVVSESPRGQRAQRPAAGAGARPHPPSSCRRSSPPDPEGLPCER